MSFSAVDCTPLNEFLTNLGELLSFGLEETWKDFVE
jgi:hypothetical protein